MHKPCLKEDLDNLNLIYNGTLTYKWVDWLESGLHGLVDGLSGDNTWGLKLNSLSLIGLNGTETVNGVSECIYDSSEHTLTNGDIHDGSSSLHDISLLNFSIKGARLQTMSQKLEVKRFVAKIRSFKWLFKLTYRYPIRQYQHYQFPSWGPYPWYLSWTLPSHQLGPWWDRRL